jgi:hypothetical protein
MENISKPGGWLARLTTPGPASLERFYYVYEADREQAETLIRESIAIIAGETFELVKVLNVHELTGHEMEPGDVKAYSSP